MNHSKFNKSSTCWTSYSFWHSITSYYPNLKIKSKEDEQINGSMEEKEEERLKEKIGIYETE